MVLSMSNTNQPHLPQRITVTMKFNFNSIFYVRYKSEEISPIDSWTCFEVKLVNALISPVVHHLMPGKTILNASSRPVKSLAGIIHL